MREELKTKYIKYSLGILIGAIWVSLGVIFILAEFNLFTGILLVGCGACIMSFFGYLLNYIERLDDYLFFQDIQKKSKELEEELIKKEIDEWNESVRIEKEIDSNK